MSNGHFQTLYPVLFRHLPLITTRRERIQTSDGDFLDLDWDTSLRSDRLAILSHGLEGHSHGGCIQGMAAALRRAGWDTLAWNLRGCSGEPNRLLRTYHSGATEDLAAVIEHASSSRRYRRIDLVGFSLGGNITLKYLGDLGDKVDSIIRTAVAFAVPCDLASSSTRLESPLNRIYMENFLRSLRKKIRDKIRRFPDQIRDTGLHRMRTFREFDGAYTAPLHGFRSAEDYWQRASCKPVLGRIAVPTLVVNAQNDPFLAPPCFPTEAAHASKHLHLETPASGGHLGFIQFNPAREYWSERRAVEFLCAE